MGRLLGEARKLQAAREAGGRLGNRKQMSMVLSQRQMP